MIRFITIFRTYTLQLKLMCNINLTEKYEYVGRLLKPGEEPASYSDEEDDNQQDSNTSNKSSDASEKPKAE